MERIIKGKRKGKTQTLIEKSYQSGDHIICHSQNEAQRIHELARRQGFIIPFPMTYKEFIEGSYLTMGVNGVLIDNVEMVIELLSNVPVEAITVTSMEGIEQEQDHDPYYYTEDGELPEESCEIFALLDILQKGYYPCIMYYDKPNDMMTPKENENFSYKSSDVKCWKYITKPKK